MLGPYFCTSKISNFLHVKYLIFCPILSSATYVIHMSYICHTYVMHMYDIYHKSVMSKYLLFVPYYHLWHMSDICRTDVTHMWHICHIYVMHKCFLHVPCCHLRHMSHICRTYVTPMLDIVIGHCHPWHMSSAPSVANVQHMSDRWVTYVIHMPYITHPYVDTRSFTLHL